MLQNDITFHYIVLGCLYFKIWATMYRKIIRKLNVIVCYLKYRPKTNALILSQDKKCSTTVNTSANGLYKHLNVHIVVDFGEAFQYRV